MTIGEIIKQVAKEKGYSVESLADAMNLSRRAIYDLFKKDNIGFKTLVQLSQILEHNFGYYIQNEYSTREDILHSSAAEFQLQEKKRKNTIRISIEIDPGLEDSDDIPDLVKKLNQAVEELLKDKE